VGTLEPDEKDPSMNSLYLVVVLGITLWLTIVFEALVGLRIVSFKGALHAKVHRWIAYAIIVGGVVHGALAFGSLVLGWF
jgi:hypothetical protein